MCKRLSQIAVVLCGMSTPVFAQTPEPPINAEAMLTALHAIRDKQTDTVKTQRHKLIQEFQTRAANPAAALDFYEAAVKATQFEGENRAQTQFVEWKKKDAVHLKSRDFQNGLRLHLNYLVLTLQRASGVETKALLPGLTSHLQQVRIEQDAGNQDHILKGKIDDSIFVRWYGIGGLIGGMENWEMSPGNMDGIYQKTIQPELRKQKDPRIVEYWDSKIQREASQATKSSLAFDAGKFDQVRKPSLLWNRAEDVLSIGQKNRAATDMFALVKGYPTHPEAAKWVARLEEVLTYSGAKDATAPPAAPAQ